MKVDPAETLRPRVEMLQASCVKVFPKGAFDEPSIRLARVRDAEAIAGGLLFEALQLERLTAPPIDDARRPMLAVLQDRLRGTVIGVAHCGVSADLVQPETIFGGMAFTWRVRAEDEPKYEAGLRAQRRTELQDYIIRHLFLEAYGWLLPTPSQSLRLEEVVFSLQNGSTVRIVTDWFLAPASAEYVQARERAVLSALDAFHGGLLGNHPWAASATGSAASAAAVTAGEPIRREAATRASDVAVRYDGKSQSTSRAHQITIRLPDGREFQKDIKVGGTYFERIQQVAESLFREEQAGATQDARTNARRRLAKAGFEPGAIKIALADGEIGRLVEVWNETILPGGELSGRTLLPKFDRGDGSKVSAVSWRVRLRDALV